MAFQPAIGSRDWCFVKLPTRFPRTLVAEDDPNDSFLLQCAFKRAAVGMAVDLVSDGSEAIEYLRGKEISRNAASRTLPGLFLLNLRMPGLDGLGVLRWLREHPHLCPARVVVFGDSESSEDIAEARSLGADHYLVKSSCWSSLDSTIARLARLPKHRLSGFDGQVDRNVQAKANGITSAGQMPFVLEFDLQKGRPKANPQRL